MEDMERLEAEEEEREFPISMITGWLQMALDELMTGYDDLAWAADKADGFPEEDRIRSIIDDVDRIEGDIRKMIRELEAEGERRYKAG